MKPERITIDQAAEILGVPERVVSQLAAWGDIPRAAKFGKRWTFDAKTFARWATNTKIDRSRIYVVQCGRAVKIGITTNVPIRMSTLQSANPLPLRLLCVFDGDEMVEKDLHQRFKRHRLQGEWFRLSPEIRAWLGTLSDD